MMATVFQKKVDSYGEDLRLRDGEVPQQKFAEILGELWAILCLAVFGEIRAKS